MLWHAGGQPFAQAVLIARNELHNPFDIAELAAVSHVLGEPDADALALAQVRTSWGTEKEPYAMEAAMRFLEQKLPGCTVYETGMHLCLNSERCDVAASLHTQCFDSLRVAQWSSKVAASL